MEYTVRAASLATGVAEDRLRTWERRYGVPSPARSETGRRLYDADLEVIRRMAALVEVGLSAASAAATVSSERDDGALSQLTELGRPSTPVYRRSSKRPRCSMSRAC